MVLWELLDRPFLPRVTLLVLCGFFFCRHQGRGELIPPANSSPGFSAPSYFSPKVSHDFKKKKKKKNYVAYSVCGKIFQYMILSLSLNTPLSFVAS